MSAKGRSYDNRRLLATMLSKPDGRDFFCRWPATLDATGELVYIRSTTNAGFRGIEARIQRLDGRYSTVSLGDLTIVARSGSEAR